MTWLTSTTWNCSPRRYRRRSETATGEGQQVLYAQPGCHTASGCLRSLLWERHQGGKAAAEARPPAPHAHTRASPPPAPTPPARPHPARTHRASKARLAPARPAHRPHRALTHLARRARPALTLPDPPCPDRSDPSPAHLDSRGHTPKALRRPARRASQDPTDPASKCPEPPDRTLKAHTRLDHRAHQDLPDPGPRRAESPGHTLRARTRPGRTDSARMRPEPPVRTLRVRTRQDRRVRPGLTDPDPRRPEPLDRTLRVRTRQDLTDRGPIPPDSPDRTSRALRCPGHRPRRRLADPDPMRPESQDRTPRARTCLVRRLRLVRKARLAPTPLDPAVPDLTGLAPTRLESRPRTPRARARLDRATRAPVRPCHLPRNPSMAQDPRSADHKPSPARTCPGHRPPPDPRHVDGAVSLGPSPPDRLVQDLSRLVSKLPRDLSPRGPPPDHSHPGSRAPDPTRSPDHTSAKDPRHRALQVPPRPDPPYGDPALDRVPLTDPSHPGYPTPSLRRPGRRAPDPALRRDRRFSKDPSHRGHPARNRSRRGRMPPGLSAAVRRCRSRRRPRSQAPAHCP